MHRKPRYPRAVSRAWLIGLALLLASCAKAPEAKAPVTEHHIHGVIQSLDPSIKTATIKHGDIPGFMSAMTMEYPIKDADAYAKLRVGETIDGTVFVKDTDFWVGDVREMK